MSGRLFVVESSPKGLRAAMLVDGRLYAVEIDRTDRPSLVGAVVEAKVVRAIPGLGTILAMADGTELLLEREKTAPVSGQIVTVQVTKAARGEKLATAKRDIALTGRALIHLPLNLAPSPQRPKVANCVTQTAAFGGGGEGRGEGVFEQAISRKGALPNVPQPPHPVPLPAGAREKENRAQAVKFSRRLIINEAQRAVLLSHFAGQPGGWIVRRTAGLADPADLAAEIANLPYQSAPNAFARLAGDNSLPPPDRILVDGLAAKRTAERWCAAFAPSLLSRIESGAAVFDHYDLDSAIEALADARINLPGGGSLIIEPTEALTVIDVNSGSDSNILNANLEAISEIARQLRLRHIGGIVVIDFISMAKPRDRDRVMAALDAALADDPAQTHILPMSAFGLVEMTRERRGPGLEFGN
jgi:ribonuclease E/ribonuclease G